MPASRRVFLSAVACLWQQAVLQAQNDITSQQQQAREAKRPAGVDAQLPTKYKFTFFTEPEQQLVRRLAARIVPADERSGGAAAARVDEYIDFILANAQPRLQKTWREGLALYAKQVGNREGQRLDAKLREFAAAEFAPRQPAEVFFVVLKSAVVEGFYTSEEGIRKELGYQGLGHLHEFPGCQHDSHQAPADYAPLLRQRV